jgi:hypothetical protein
MFTAAIGDGVAIGEGAGLAEDFEELILTQLPK